MDNIKQIKSVKQWIKRRRNIGLPISSDDIWQHIKREWPSLSEATQEYIFERV